MGFKARASSSRRASSRGRACLCVLCMQRSGRVPGTPKSPSTTANGTPVPPRQAESELEALPSVTLPKRKQREKMRKHPSMQETMSAQALTLVMMCHGGWLWCKPLNLWLHSDHGQTSGHSSFLILRSWFPPPHPPSYSQLLPVTLSYKQPAL